MANVVTTINKIDSALDTIDELLSELPLRNDKRKMLSSLLYQFWEQLEDELIMPSADWEQ